MHPAIKKKVAELNRQGFNIGRTFGNEQKFEPGYVQDFENATIFYSTRYRAARALWGTIRDKYKKGASSDSRYLYDEELGFPTWEMRPTVDMRCNMASFSNGVMYDIYGCVKVFSDIHDQWKKAGGHSGKFGYPVSDVLSLGGGHIVFFEFGAIYKGNHKKNVFIEILYNFPTLGQPLITSEGDFLKTQFISLSCNQGVIEKMDALELFTSLLHGVFFFRSVKDRKEILLFPDKNTLQKKKGKERNKITWSIAFKTAPGTTLANQTLYDICIILPSTTKIIISPHCFYLRDSWTDFKFIHATDIHVSRRVDSFRKVLAGKKIKTGSKELVNFNDSFRQFIQYANTLHKKGELDFIMITGDLVDFDFESSFVKNYQTDNFVFLESLITGTASDDDLEASDELIVPVFTALGNHDYRTVPYSLISRVLIPDAIADQIKNWSKKAAEYIDNGTVYKIEQLFEKGIDELKDVIVDGINKGKSFFDRITGSEGNPIDMTRDVADQTSTFNLLTKEGMALLTRSQQELTGEEAREFIDPDEGNKNGNLDYYFRYLNAAPTYEVKLGKHSLIMIDGKWDKDTVGYLAEGIMGTIGIGSEEKIHFSQSTPESIGFVKSEIDLLKGRLNRDGLVIVGVHAPLINGGGGDYPYFFRESIRENAGRAFSEEMHRYIYNRTRKSLELVKKNAFAYIPVKDNGTWMKGETGHFHLGNGDDLLDYGVMRNLRQQFLKACAGIGVSRPADLIFSGHIHVNWECRIKWDKEKKKFRFYSDFYTENPKQYYNHFFNTIPPDLSVTLDDGMKQAKVFIDPKAPKNPKVEKNRKGEYEIRTKPNKEALEFVPKQRLKKWWDDRKPLFIQTSAVGPGQLQRSPNARTIPDMRGCRLISIQNDQIVSIKYVLHNQIAKAAVSPPFRGTDSRIPKIIYRTKASNLKTSWVTKPDGSKEVSASAVVHDHRDE